MSILAGVEERLDAFFIQMCGCIDRIGNPPHYKHKESAQCLSKERPSGQCFGKVLKNIIDLIKGNRDKGRNQEPSMQNWRLEQRPAIDPSNRNPETKMEREMVTTKDNGWFNQVPTASGLYDGERDQHRNIDLIHKVGDAEYEFVELKVKSDTPLRAAMEIVQYAALYIFARRQRLSSDKELLKANVIHLKVLAPPGYYSSYNFGWLQESINEGLKELRDDGLRLDFEFLAYDPRKFDEQAWNANGPLNKMKGIERKWSK